MERELRALVSLRWNPDLKIAGGAFLATFDTHKSSHFWGHLKVGVLTDWTDNFHGTWWRVAQRAIYDLAYIVSHGWLSTANLKIKL